MPNSPSIYCRFFVYAVTFIGLISCANTKTSSPEDIIKSPNDQRAYRHLILGNQLEVLLVSDPKADKAAASLDVLIGSGDDPENREGLAHFLEHMLFLGTEKYPEAGEYQQFINEHGGSHNAFTANEHTNYFFDVQPEALEQALDRFAQFFTSPLFNAEYVEREKNAVNAEYQLKLKDDGRRQYDVLKNVINPAHRLANFSVGSLETLADREGSNIRDELLRFYRTYYSANLMKLVIIGHEPLDELARMAQEKFSAIPNYQRIKPREQTPLFAPGILPLRVHIKPVKEQRHLLLQFPVPPINQHYQSKPVSYLANLLGDEGNGSLLSYLKDRGWVESLSAGLGFAGQDYATVQLRMSLTRSGLNNIDAITESVFAAIELIRSTGIKAWRYREQGRLQALSFQFQEPGANIHYATSLANRLHDYPVSDVLRAPYALDRFDADLIRRYLDHLRPDNMLLTVIDPSLSADRQTRHFQAPYSTSTISESALKRFSNPQHIPQLKLPGRNLFIPTQLAMLDSDIENPVPTKQIAASGFTLWHRTDTSFNTPRADFYFSVRSPLAHNTARNALLTELYVAAVNNELEAFSYPAYLAGLNYRLYKHIRGLTVRISGYQDKQPILLDNIVRALTQPKLDGGRFKLNREELIRSLENAAKDRPYNQAIDWVSKLLISPQWTEQEMLAELETISHQELVNFVPQLLQQVEMVALANGNISAAQARLMAQQLQTAFQTEQRHTPVPRLPFARLVRGNQYLLPIEVTHPDSALVSYFQGQDKSLATKSHFSLLQQILGTPYYHELRTRQQLGYVVFASPLSILDAPALAFIVQSPTVSSAELDTRTRQFITQFRPRLAAMDDATLTQHKQAIISRITERDTRLNQRSNRYWHEIDRENYNFDTREQLVQTIESVDKDSLLASFDRYLLNKETIRNLNIHAIGENFSDRESNGRTLVEDLKGFQRAGDYF